MPIIDLAVATPVAHPGMTVRELFEACVEAGVPGLPFRNRAGQISGKASIRHVMKESCIPDYMVRHHHLLGDEIGYLRINNARARALLEQSIDDYLFPDLPRVNSHPSVCIAPPQRCWGLC